MKPKRLLVRIQRGDFANIRFNDFRRLVEAYGFRQTRTSGSHLVFEHPRVPRPLPLQPRGNQAKPYQIREFLGLIARYHLSMEA